MLPKYKSNLLLRFPGHNIDITIRDAEKMARKTKSQDLACTAKEVSLRVAVQTWIIYKKIDFRTVCALQSKLAITSTSIS